MNFKVSVLESFYFFHIGHEITIIIIKVILLYIYLLIKVIGIGDAFKFLNIISFFRKYFILYVERFSIIRSKHLIIFMNHCILIKNRK